MTPLDKEIIRCFADNSMNAAEAAKSLYLHRNTVLYHIDRVKRETGLNARVFHDLVELLERIEADDEE